MDRTEEPAKEKEKGQSGSYWYHDPPGKSWSKEARHSDLRRKWRQGSRKNQVLTILSKSDEVGKRNTLSRVFKGGEYLALCWENNQ